MEIDVRLLLSNLLIRPIAFHVNFARVAGGALPGLFLSQLYYWHDKGKEDGGWIYKTQKDWNDETAMSRPEQENARRVLRQRGLLEEKKVGLPAKLYYRLNLDALVQASLALATTQTDSQPSLLETDILVCRDATDIHTIVCDCSKRRS